MWCSKTIHAYFTVRYEYDTTNHPPHTVRPYTRCIQFNRLASIHFVLPRASPNKTTTTTHIYNAHSHIAIIDEARSTFTLLSLSVSFAPLSLSLPPSILSHFGMLMAYDGAWCYCSNICVRPHKTYRHSPFSVSHCSTSVQFFIRRCCKRNAPSSTKVLSRLIYFLYCTSKFIFQIYWWPEWCVCGRFGVCLNEATLSMLSANWPTNIIHLSRPGHLSI